MYENLTKEELISELELLKAEKENVVTDAEENSKKLMLENMVSIRKVLSDILKLLLTPGDEAIDQALLLLIPFFKVDRVYIGTFEEKDCSVDFTHEVTENEILSLREDLLRKLSEEEAPWWVHTFKSGKDVVIYDIEDMPAEAANEQQLLRLQDVRSLLALPMFRDGTVYGFIGLDAVKEYKQWNAVDIENLRMLADIISVAMERSKALKEKEKADSRFRELYKNMPLGYLYKRIIFNQEGKPSDLEYLDINPIAEKIFGFKAEDGVGNTFNNLAGNDLPHDVLESQITVAQNKTPLLVERIEMYKGRLIKFINYSPSPNHVVTLCTEFSTIPQLKETLLRSEAKFKMIFDKLPWGVELYDSKGFLMDINDADLAIFETTHSDALGLNMFDNPNIPDYVNEKLKRGEDVSFRLNYNFRAVNNSQYYETKLREGVKHLQVKGVPLKDEKNTIFGYLYIVFDDTENFCKNEQTQNNLAKLKVAMDTDESIIWEYDAETDKLMVNFHMNENTENNAVISALRKHPITNKKEFFQTLHPDDREEVYYHHFLPLLKGEIKNYSIMYRRILDNQLIWFMSNVRAYKFNPDGTPNKIVSYATDITAKIQMQDKLHEIQNENKMLGYAISQSNNEIFAVDSEGYFVFCNQRVMDNYGFKEPVSQYKFNNINPEFNEEKWYALREELRVCQSVTFESTHHLVNNDHLPVEIYIYRVEDKQWGELFWCFTRDIQERIKQRQKISWLNSLMDTILNNVPVAIWVKSINEDFKHIYFNSAAENFTGKRAEDVLNKTDFEIFDNIQDAIDERNEDMQAVKNGSSSKYAIEYTTFKGDVRIINSIRILVNFPNSDNLPMIIVLIWDITDQRKNEIELVKVKEADKLKSAFLANMSHEIRTPLNAIVGFSNIMSETENAGDRQLYKEIINKNNDLLLQLINDILDFSKIEAGMIEFTCTPTDIKEVFHEIYQIHSLKLKADIQMVFDEKNSPSVIINTDMKRIIQVLSNFITNAIKFTEKGSITLTYQIKNKELLVSVTDTGIGIPEEYRNLIFERFVKVNDFRQGTGLGLSISKMIIESLGGRIGVDSEIGKGSTFWFTLPLEKENKIENLAETHVSAPRVEKATVSEVAVLSTKKSILIAEDVTENYLLLKTLLGKNYHLYHAWNGQEAVDLYKKYQPDLILMDMKMPVMNGFEATREIRKLSLHVPIIALTAFAFETEKQEAIACGINDYVVKPVEITSFRQLIMRFLQNN